MADKRRDSAHRSMASDHRAATRDSQNSTPDLRQIRIRHPGWRIDWCGDSYQARWKDGLLLKAATQEELTTKLRSAPTGAIGSEAIDELSPLKAKFPRYWMQPVHEGYLAVPRGVFPILAPTLDELGKKIQRPG